MPIYEYLCKKCRKPFEHMAFNSNDKPVCPECGGKNLSKLMSAGSIMVSPAPFACNMDGGCGPDMCGSGGCGGCGGF